MTRCAVIGAGAWGTALSQVLASSGHEVRLWAYEPDVVEAINGRHVNDRFLANVALDPSIRATNAMEEAIAGASLITLVTPSHVLRAVVKAGANDVAANATIVVATKGIERGSLAVMSRVIEEELPGRDVVALSGPSFAAEVAARQPTALVAAAKRAAAAECVQHAFSTDALRVYTHDDLIGVELGGALKNVIAVATGIAEGLGLGFNPRAALITRGLAEIARLGIALGASPGTFAGLAGMGDLVLTCTGALSRNRAVGIEIGSGKSLAEVLRGRDTVAEGVTTTESAQALAEREGVEMPIVNAVWRALFADYPPRDAITELMTRELRSEQDR